LTGQTTKFETKRNKPILAKKKKLEGKYNKSKETLSKKEEEEKTLGGIYSLI
jgi:hypothetical protein